MDETLAILVIDDSEDDRTLCRRSLKEALGEGLRFTEAASGESGLHAIDDAVPHCVLLDYSLPGRNGIEVLKRIRVRHPHLPVIMLTGQGNEAIAVQSMKEGAQDYIAKNTITASTLQRVVRTAIEHGTLQKNIHEQRTSLEIFTRALAHDLKEPVRSIRSFLDLIDDWNELCENSQRSFQYIRKSADRMNALIDAVHLYTRLDGAEQMPRETCDLNQVMEEVRENLAKLIEECGAKISCDALPEVDCSRVQMLQLFQNLLANAIRHCDVGVTIHVGAHEHRDHWRLTVRDNGPGIAPEHLEKIFDPFKRLSRGNGGGAGLGLGLAISRKIVESHGGKIWCESEFGAGTAFVFTFPNGAISAATANNTPTTIPLSDAQSIGGALAQARILFVDDNEGDIELNRIFLIKKANLRCDLLTARDGKDALAKLREAAKADNPIDLILLDINMPGMSGFELLMQMGKEDPPLHPLVVMCTTSAYDMDKRTAASLGAAGYLTKPPQFPLLKDIIDQCGRLRLIQEGTDYVLLRAA